MSCRSFKKGQSRNCMDKEYSDRANNPRLEKWHSSDVYSSEEACHPENKQINEELQGKM